MLIAVLTLSACGGDNGSSDDPLATPSAAIGRVDVGGYELAYECRGSGSPTIVTEAGYDSPGTTTWSGLMDDLAATTRVCAYDRAGTGASDPRPDVEGLTSADQAAELDGLLQGAGIQPPYVLVAHSYGGFVSRLFAEAHQAETAGIVLIESSHEDEIKAYRRFYGDDPEGDWVDGGDLLDIEATKEALRDARDYGDIPLVAIRAERYEDVLARNLWIQTQADLATLSRNGVHVVALHSGHFVMETGENPEVVLAAVEAVVQSARSGEPLPSCEALFGHLAAQCP
ncbi:MAG TPA: alpha/beta hydrolase [Actinomycetota bacterium]|nr:alpha/beta hydrolase [Actinomycetota bacterium]